MSIDESWRRGPGLVASVWRYRTPIALAVLVAGAATLLFTMRADPVYEASARLFLSDPRGGSVFNRETSVDPERYVPQQAERVTSRPVLQEAARLIGEDTDADSIGRRVRAEGDITLDLITITATADTGEGAAELANTAAEAYTSVARDVRLEAAQRAVDELREAETALDQQIQELRAESEVTEGLIQQQIDVLVAQRIDVSSRAQELLVDARVFGSGVDVVERAEAPRDPVAPTPRRTTALVVVLVAAAASALAYWRAGNIHKVESSATPGDILHLPLLGTLPVAGRREPDTLDNWIALDPAEQEAYHFLLTSIEYAMQRVAARSILVTSATPGEGKTETCLQLAVGAVLDGRRVVIVDGDLRMRALTRRLHMDRATGLVDLATGDTNPGWYRRAVRNAPMFTGERTLPVVPAGSEGEDGSASLRHAGVARAIRDMSRDHDLAIIDSAPLLATADTTLLASHVDAVVLVVREGARVADLESLRDRLGFLSAPVLGYAYVSSSAPSLAEYGYTADRAARATLEQRDRPDAPTGSRWRPDKSSRPWHPTSRPPSSGAPQTPRPRADRPEARRSRAD